MFAAYVIIGNKEYTKRINTNPYVIQVEGNDLYLKEISKDDADGLVYYLIDELSPEEIYKFKEHITVIGINDIIRLRKDNRL